MRNVIGGIIATMLIFGAGFAVAKMTEPGTVLSQPAELDASQILSKVNYWRKSKSLHTYKRNEALCDVAKIRAIEIKTDWSHDGFHEPGKQVSMFALSGNAKLMGENLARDYSTEDDVLKGWLQSPTHLENLQKDFTDTCIVTNGVYVVQIFANY